MAPKELREAAERYRTANYPPAGAEWCDHWMPIQEAKDMRTLADAYLTTVPADDAEPAGMEWFKSLGAEYNWGRWRIDGPIDMQLAEYDGPEGKWLQLSVAHRNDEFDIKADPTKGDVRRLISALGIEVNKPCP
jgi:hypothetical protein